MLVLFSAPPDDHAGRQQHRLLSSTLWFFYFAALDTAFNNYIATISSKQLKNPLTSTDFYKALAPHRLSTLRNCQKVDASDKLGKMFRCGSTWRLELTTFPFFNPATPFNCCHQVPDQRQNVKTKEGKCLSSQVQRKGGG